MKNIQLALFADKEYKVKLPLFDGFWDRIIPLKETKQLGLTDINKWKTKK